MFTIRGIEGIKSNNSSKNIYDTIMTIYGAIYQKKKMKEKLELKLKSIKL